MNGRKHHQDHHKLNRSIYLVSPARFSEKEKAASSIQQRRKCPHGPISWAPGGEAPLIGRGSRGIFTFNGNLPLVLLKTRGFDLEIPKIMVTFLSEALLIIPYRCMEFDYFGKNSGQQRDSLLS
jgi:hypothetical protein